MDTMENNVAPQQTEEEGIDIMALLRNLWDGRKTVLICLGIFVALGLTAALTMKRAYTVKTIMGNPCTCSRSTKTLRHSLTVSLKTFITQAFACRQAPG